MSQFAFLHVADIHLDSPLAHLRRLDSRTAERLQRASRRSLENVIAAALQHEVAAVVIAGDLFDGPVKDSGGGIWVESQLKRLTREGIRVVLIRGNHDALSNARQVLNWPEGIDEFGSDRPQTLHLDDCGIAIHGQSFGARVELDDLAASYPMAEPGYFNVGVLHTSLSGSPQHDTYAPTSVGLLESKGYDYWALGHIHQRSSQSLSDKCYIGFSGNTQGRHIREAGAKGCQLVTVRDRQLASVQFIPTDSLRWFEIQVDIEQASGLGEIEELLHPQSVRLLENAEGRPLAVRVRLCGQSKLHSELTRTSTQTQLTDTLGTRLNELGDIWLESIKVATRPAHAVSADDMLQPLKYLCDMTNLARSDAQTQQEIMQSLEELLKKARSDLAEVDWPLTNPECQSEEFERLVRQAEDLLVARLMTGGSR